MKFQGFHKTSSNYVTTLILRNLKQKGQILLINLGYCHTRDIKFQDLTKTRQISYKCHLRTFRINIYFILYM